MDDTNVKIMEIQHFIEAVFGYNNQYSSGDIPFPITITY